MAVSKKMNFAAGFSTPFHRLFAVKRLLQAFTANIAAALGLIVLTGCTSEPVISPSNAAPEITRWILPDDDIVSALSEEPRECLPEDASGQNILGRLAFRSPFLLGGQAARRGLTCQACHSQGQTNFHFFVEGLSDAPGTADVTSFHFSDELGDEIFNPVPIPSLSDDIETVSFSPETDDLDKFVHRLITKEFTGPEPVPDVEAALLSYIRALDDRFCATPTIADADLWQFNIRVINESFAALQSEAQSKAARDFMMAALRVELGRLHDRLPNHPKLRASLVSISQKLNTVKQAEPSIGPALSEWQRLEIGLAASYERSLFNKSAIEKWLADG